MSAQPPSDDEALYDELRHVLRQFLGSDPLNTRLQSWLLVRRIVRTQGLRSDQAVRRCLLEALERLAEQNSEYAVILRRHYLEGAEVHVIARELAQVEGTINKKQRHAITQLAALLSQQESAEREAKQQRSISRLGALASSRLFGVDALLEQIRTGLAASGPPWLIILEGMGGSGKSALADRVARFEAARLHWEEVAWVTVQEPGFTAGQFFDALYEQLFDGEDAALPTPKREQQVRAALKSYPHLVVVDNLNSPLHSEPLVALLAEMASPSKFVLTMRCNLPDTHRLMIFRIPDLEFDDAAALLRWEAQERSLAALTAATSVDFAAIYTVVGGNPLALRWVAAQTREHALDAVLASLQQAAGKRAKALYTRIFRPTWELLDEGARQTLMLLPAVSGAEADIDSLLHTGGMTLSTLHAALDQLMMFNLVDSCGDLHVRCYSIRNLTRTFLHSEALHW